MTTKAKVTPINRDFSAIQVMSTILSRAVLMGQLGMSYDGDRDMYNALGYPKDITYYQYLAAYTRQDMARAVIDRPVTATWQGGFKVLESDDKEETPLEKAWEELSKRLKIQARLMQLDRLTGLGSYGVLLLGLSDCKDVSDFSKPVQGVKHDLLYLKPFGGMVLQGSAQINSYVTDPTDERYGKPLTYRIMVNNLSIGVSELLQVHYSRVIHVTDGLLESEIEGMPRLMCVWNRLMDLEKVIGGSGEMFWRGARPGYSGTIDKEFQATPDDLSALEDQIKEYENSLRRFLVTKGVDIKALGSPMHSPQENVAVCIQMISAVTGIPQRILSGSERGQLASTQDRDNWFDFVDGRRQELAEPVIIRPFIDRLIELQILPPPVKEYAIQWQDLRTPSDKDKADVGATRSTAIKNYASTPGAELVVPKKSFYQICLGLDDDEVSLIEEELQAALGSETNAPEMQPGGGEVVPPEVPAAVPGDKGGEAPANPKQVTTQGGPGSGNFGHSGVPGQWGGSGKGGGSKGNSKIEEKTPSKEITWKPSMSLAEAKEWAKNSDFKDPLFHGTTAGGVEGISNKGFDEATQVSASGGAMYGNGFYFTSNKDFATRYAKEGTQPLRIMVNCEKVCNFPEFTKLMNTPESKIKMEEAWKDPLNKYGKIVTEIVRGAGYDALNLKYDHGHHEFIVYDKTKITVIK